MLWWIAGGWKRRLAYFITLSAHINPSHSLSVQLARGGFVFLHCAVCDTSCLSDVCLRFIKPFFLLLRKGTRGFSFSGFCWLCAVLEREAENFSKDSAGPRRDEAPLSPRLHAPPAATVCLPAAASECPHSVMLRRWHYLSASDGCWEFFFRSHKPKKKSPAYITCVDHIQGLICSRGGENLQNVFLSGRDFAGGQVEETLCFNWHEFVFHCDVPAPLCSFYPARVVHAQAQRRARTWGRQKQTWM